MKSKSTIILDNTTLPTYLDGSDGSLWASRDAWEIMLSESAPDVSTRRFIRVSDFLALMKLHKIELTHNEVTDSSSGGTVITQQ